LPSQMADMRLVIISDFAIDGLYGTNPPDYARFESAMIEGVRDIARNASETAADRLEAALSA
jgi:hypothetical protein